jgi:hypothetical protein
MRWAVGVDDDGLQRLGLVALDLQLRDHLWHQCVDGLKVGDGIVNLFVERVDAVEPVEQ